MLNINTAMQIKENLVERKNANMANLRFLIKPVWRMKSLLDKWNIMCAQLVLVGAFFFFSSSSSSSRGEVGEAYVNIDELERDGPVRPDTERALRPRHTSHKTVFKTALRTQTDSQKFASHTCIKPGPDMHTETRLRVLYGCMHTGKGQRGFSTLKFTAGCLRLLENQVHPTHSPLLHFVFVPYRKNNYCARC